MFVRILLLFAAAALLVAIAARQSSGAGHPQNYRVRAGDTLWSIATAHYAGDPREAVWRIERRNHLLGAALEPGQILVLPVG
jgi:nucleoid-associated protein YgaU